MLLLALLAGPLLAEATLRWLLFSPDPLGTYLGAGLRRPEYFAPPGALPEYWKLHMRFHADAGVTCHPQADERIGWGRPDLDPVTLLPKRLPSFEGRRPVLWFGASFVACSAQSGACWETLFERHSELARDHVLINYGIWGHGIDQTLLLLREVLDPWAEHDPIVVLGFVAETDLYRPTLSAFGWPKPRFELSDDGQLQRVDPPAWNFDEYLDQDPVGITSYAWRALDINLLGRSDLELRQRYGLHRYELQGLQLSCLLLREIHRELRDRDLDHFGMFFHTEGSARSPEACQGFFDTAQEWLAGAGPPMVNLTPALAGAEPHAPADLETWFLRGGVDNGHLTETARRSLLPLLEQGIRAQYGEPTAVVEAGFARNSHR
ncbi:MAG: hypothetical protein ACYS26_05075 [Planctomycetota bacterium]|jgi:hypothetical protein